MHSGVFLAREKSGFVYFKWIASVFPAACCRVKRANMIKKYFLNIRFPVLATGNINYLLTRKEKDGINLINTCEGVL